VQRLGQRPQIGIAREAGLVRVEVVFAPAWITPLLSHIRMFSPPHAQRHVVLRGGDRRGAGAGEDDPHLLDLACHDSSALSSAAPEITAVPCWSSWKTGISSRRFSSSSM
jgi:hypothetical protein